MQYYKKVKQERLPDQMFCGDLMDDLSSAWCKADVPVEPSMGDGGCIL